MDLILAAIVGWCGTGWPIRFPYVGGGGGVEPGDWPPNCPVCGPIVGALAGAVIVYAFGSHFASAGMLGTVTLAFFGGSFGASLIGGIRQIITKR
jgi:hypothetical protein